MLIVSASNAEARFRSLELTATLSIDGVAFRRIMEREVEAHRRRFGPRSAGMLSASSGEKTGESDGSWTRQRWRIWWVPLSLPGVPFNLTP